MQVAIVTVGDELLAGDTENTNATWLAGQLADRGARVVRVLTVPDDHEAIAAAVARYRDRYDAVLVTGGLGGTHDDVTMAAVADAVDRELAVDASAREQVVETAAAYRDANPDVFDRYELEFDPDAWAERPVGSRVVENDAGLAPGCVVDPDDAAGGTVYVLPGPPRELRAVFGRVAAAFAGDLVSETLYTPMPEAALRSRVAAVRDEFDVAAGSYPAEGADHNRVKVSGEDPKSVAAAADWLREHLDVVDADG